MDDHLWTILATILGLLVGAGLTILTGKYQSTHETRLKLKEKLLDRRIDAHEKIISSANSMILMTPIMAEVQNGKVEQARTDEGELMRYPKPMHGREEFRGFCNTWTETFSSFAIWLSNDLVRELYLFQDYTVNLSQYLDTISNSKIPFVGSIIRQDFIDFSTNIRRLAYKYLYSDLHKLNLDDNLAWHKYKPEETRRRLFQTELFKQSTLLSKIENIGPELVRHDQTK